MTNFTKRALTDLVAEKCKVPQHVASDVVTEFLTNVRAMLLAGHRIELRDFGTFETKTRKARVARNPSTGEKINLPPRRGVVFRPGQTMKPWEIPDE